MAARAKLQLKTEKPAVASPVPKPSPDESKASASAKRPDRNGTRMIGGHFPHATWAQLRKLAVDENRTTQELLAEAMDDLFSKYLRT
jgi:hypothetical protein